MFNNSDVLMSIEDWIDPGLQLINAVHIHTNLPSVKIHDVYVCTSYCNGFDPASKVTSTKVNIVIT